MDIGILAVDSNYPNLALMKISAWHKARGDNVEWYNPLCAYDKVYSAKVFSFTPDYGYYINGLIKNGFLEVVNLKTLPLEKGLNVSNILSKLQKVEKMSKINSLVNRAIASYTTYQARCDDIAKEAQKYIDWNDNVKCEYFPSDGLCLTIDSDRSYVCPVGLFFEYIEEYGVISESDFIKLCI